MSDPTTLPTAPLLAWLGKTWTEKQSTEHHTTGTVFIPADETVIASQLNMAPRTIARWIQRGTITGGDRNATSRSVTKAEQIADHLGTTPRAIWGELYDDAVGALYDQLSERQAARIFAP